LPRSTPFLGDSAPETLPRSTPEELFHGYPPEFASSLSYVKSLLSGKKPDYKFHGMVFQGLFARLSFEEDYGFDWITYSMNNLAGVLSDQPKYDQAEEIHRNTRARKADAR